MTEMNQTFEVCRPTDPIAQYFLNKVVSRFNRIGIAAGISNAALKSLEVNKAPDPKISLILGGELLRYHRINQLPYAPQQVNELADHVAESLPDELDRSIVARSLPSTIFNVSDKGRWLNIGDSKVLGKERQQAQAVVDGFYTMQGVKLQSNSWLDYDNVTSFKLFKTVHAESDVLINMVKTVVDVSTDLLPGTLEYGPVSVNDASRP